MAFAARLGAGYTEEALVAASNKGIYKRALKDAEGLGEITVSAGSDLISEFVEVKLPDGDVALYGNISDCRCSCPSKTICRHIVTAALIISSLAEEGKPAAEKNEEAAPKEVIPEPSSEELCPDKKYLIEVMEVVGGILRKGMVSCSKNDADGLTRLSLSAPTVHREIGSMCRSAASDIAMMSERKAGFSHINAASRLCRIYNTARVSLTEEGKSLLFSGNEYEPVGNCEFICIGIFPHRSSSGFAGVTAVLFAVNEGRFYTYTSGMPDIYSKTENAGSLENLTKLKKAHSHWENDVSLEMLSGHRFTLYGAKADKSGKLSSTKQTVCRIGGSIFSSDIPSLAEAVPEEEYDYFSPVKAARFAAVSMKRLTGVRFDTASQTLFYTVVTPNGDICCETAYSSLSAEAVRYLDRLADKELDDGYMVLRFFGKRAEAVAMADAWGIHNFYFKGEK